MDDDGPDDTGPCGKIAGMCFSVMFGLMLFPASLVFTGWNENRAVCRAGAISAAQADSADLVCADPNSGAAGQLGYLGCGLDRSTFTNFTDKSPYMTELGMGGFDVIFQTGATQAVKLQMTVEMAYCHQECVRWECTRRLEEADSEEEDLADADAESENEPQRSLLSPRQTPEDSRRLKKSSSDCTKRCVEWEYYPEYTSDATTIQNENWVWTPQATAKCGGSMQANPSQTPLGMTLGTKEVLSAANQVKVEGGGWALNTHQVQTLSYNSETEPQVALKDDPEKTPWLPGQALTNVNSRTFLNIISTCKGEYTMGCIKVSFQQSTPVNVNVLNKIESPGLFSEGVWEEPGAWLCETQGVQRICPSSLLDMNKGWVSCSGGQTKEEFFSTMRAENDMATWGYRLAAFIGVFMGISCILSPITTMVNMVLDGADYLTGWIPGIGCLVDNLTDLISGVVGCVVFCISLFFAFSCFSMVAGVVWVAMRPMIGIPCFIIACCCFAGGIFTCMQVRTPKDKGHNDEGDSDEEHGLNE